MVNEIELPSCQQAFSSQIPLAPEGLKVKRPHREVAGRVSLVRLVNKVPSLKDSLRSAFSNAVGPRHFLFVDGRRLRPQ